MLDTHDRLVALSIIPVPSLPSPAEKHAADMKDLLARVGWDIGELSKRTKLTLPPPTHCDRVEEQILARAARHRRNQRILLVFVLVGFVAIIAFVIWAAHQ